MVDVLKKCKKYMIQGIDNPGTYLVVENENEVHNKRKIKRFERSLAKDVVKCKDPKKIKIGQVVAVKDDEGFHRAKIADIFKRSCKTMYWVLLIDSGKTIETHDKNIYLIKNKKSKEEILEAFKISVHGIQPAVLDINYENSLSGGIFQKRKCNNWSEGAYKFVRDLFMNDPHIYIHIINCDETISGEIYFIQDSKAVSLGKKLCDKGFAIFCDTEKKSKNYNQTDYCVKEIEEKIPENALLDNYELRKSIKKLSTPKEAEKKTSGEAGASQKLSFKHEGVKKDSSSSGKKPVFENLEKSKSCIASHKTLVSSKTFSDSDKTLNKEDENEQIRLNVCRIVLRNLKYFNQQKHNAGGHTQD